MFKAAIVVLLAGNAVYFALTGATTKALDAGAWLALLVLFEAEIRYPERLRDARVCDLCCVLHDLPPLPWS